MLRQSLAVLAVVGLPLVSAGRPAGFHNHLVKASPTVDGEIPQAPTEIVLWFSEQPEVKLSTVKVRSAIDTTRIVATGAVVAGPEAKSLLAPVTGRMVPGEYQVVYRTAGTDGHIVRGTYRFILK